MAINRKNENQHLALLVAAPWQGNAMMHNDLTAMYDALRLRGFQPSQILSIEGGLSRQLLIAIFREVRKRIASWSYGEIFFYYSGHGIFAGTKVSEARPALHLQNSQNFQDNSIFWDEVFSILDLPAEIKFILLPDC